MIITVLRKSATQYEVTVTDSSTTVHVVTLSDDFFVAITGGDSSKETLIKKSFEFLLERENNTMILQRFDLPMIGRYYPEYEQVIKKKL